MRSVTWVQSKSHPFVNTADAFRERSHTHKSMPHVRPTGIFKLADVSGGKAAGQRPLAAVSAAAPPPPPAASAAGAGASASPQPLAAASAAAATPLSRLAGATGGGLGCGSDAAAAGLHGRVPAKIAPELRRKARATAAAGPEVRRHSVREAKCAEKFEDTRV